MSEAVLHLSVKGTLLCTLREEQVSDFCVHFTEPAYKDAPEHKEAFRLRVASSAN